MITQFRVCAKHVNLFIALQVQPITILYCFVIVVSIVADGVLENNFTIPEGVFL
jgi:hypothetical protein